MEESVALHCFTLAVYNTNTHQKWNYFLFLAFTPKCIASTTARTKSMKSNIYFSCIEKVQWYISCLDCRQEAAPAPAVGKEDISFQEQNKGDIIFVSCLNMDLSHSESVRFIITKKASIRAFSWLKAPNSAFTFKTLLFRSYSEIFANPRLKL